MMQLRKCGLCGCAECGLHQTESSREHNHQQMKMKMKMKMPKSETIKFPMSYYETIDSLRN